MTTIDTTALRALAEAATPGPWSRDLDGERYLSAPATGAHLVNYGVPVEQKQRDAVHIAAFHPGTALALLDEVEALRAQVERVREQAQRVSDEFSDPVYQGNGWAQGVAAQADVTLAKLDGEVAA